MSRLNFVLGDVGYCKVQITDLYGPRCFFMDSEKEEKTLEVDIYGDSFDLIVTPLIPNFEKELDELDEIDRNTLKGKIQHKLVSATANFVKGMFFLVECTYHVKNFRDGDTVYLNHTIYSYPTNDDLHPLWWLSPEFLDMVFPVAYMFYDTLLNSARIEPKSTSCINRKKAIKKARQFVIVSSSIFEPIGYPIQMVRIRYLSRERKIFSSLLKFSRMDEEKRWKYTGDTDFYENIP